MSRSLSYQVVMEELQQVLHDLHDLAMFRENHQFRGVVFRDIDFVWRDHPLSHWTIRIEPTTPDIRPRPLTEVLRDVEVDQPTDSQLQATEEDAQGAGTEEPEGGDPYQGVEDEAVVGDVEE
jgi:hypothetical protein